MAWVETVAAAWENLVPMLSCARRQTEAAARFQQAAFRTWAEGVGVACEGSFLPDLAICLPVASISYPDWEPLPPWLKVMQLPGPHSVDSAFEMTGRPLPDPHCLETAVWRVPPV